MSYIDELTNRVMLELAEIMLYCTTCEFQVRELFKVANCIFDRDEFFAVVDAFTIFKHNMENLETLLDQLESQVSMLQIVTLKSMVNGLRGDYTKLLEILAVADNRIEADKIDFDGAELLGDLIDKIDYDIVDFDSFHDAHDSAYFVPYLVAVDDVAHDPRYGNLSVLMVALFKTKREAYTYALKNGISRDRVWGVN